MLLDGRTVHLRGDDGSLAAGLAALGAEVVTGDGPVDLVVHVVTDPDGLAERPLSDTGADEWARRCDGVITEAIDAAKDAHRRLSGRGGRLVFVLPSLGLTGAAGLVPFATAVEGVRALSKSAARQWGADGVTVACVARHVAGPTVALSSVDQPTDADVAGVIALLAHEHASSVTGATLVLDGGTVLVP
jgi:3-oxoacyl-[acyl-carrier protein] reductase